MRLFFALLLLALIAVCYLAWQAHPLAIKPGKTQLLWATDANPYRPAQIAPFEKKFPSYHVNLDPNDAEAEKIIVQSLAGVGPDLFDCYTPYQLTAYVRAGAAWDLTDEMPKIKVDVRKLAWPAVWPDCISQGRVYGFPASAGVDGIWFNKTFFDASHIPYPTGPWTWDQLIATAQKLVRRDDRGKITRYGILLDWHVAWPQFILQWGGHLYSPDGTRCTLDSPEAIAGIQFMQDTIYKYNIAPEPVERADTITLFNAGRSAMALGGRYWLCVMRSLPDLRVAATECPYHDVRIFRGYGRATLINKNSPHRLESLHWLQYEASADYNNLINQQADGIAPVMQYTQTPRFLNDPRYPDETYNAVWANMLKLAVGDTPSPYLPGEVSNRIVINQLDLIKQNLKSVPDAMHDAAAQINAQIQQSIQQNPELKKRYDHASR